MSKNWSATDAQLLKRLREAAGVSPDVLAKRHTLSTAQVRELEGQDSGRFYTEDIKAYVGQRLLLALGHVPPVAPPSPQPAPPKAAPVAQAAVPKPPVPATEAPPPAALAQPVAAQPVVPPRARASTAAAERPVGVVRQASEARESSEAPAPSQKVQPAMAATASGTVAPDASPSGRAWLGWLLLVALGLVAWLMLQPAARKPAPTVAEEVASPPPVAAAEPTPPAASAPASPTLAATPAVTSPAATTPAATNTAAPANPSAAAPAVAEAKPAATVACEWPKSGNPLAYKSPVENKPASYIYVESRGDVQVCIRDARGTESAFRLAAGQSRNIPGTAPYNVRSSDWGQTRVFFQGALVRLESPTPPESLQLLPYSAD